MTRKHHPRRDLKLMLYVLLASLQCKTVVVIFALVEAGVGNPNLRRLWPVSRTGVRGIDDI